MKKRISETRAPGRVSEAIATAERSGTLKVKLITPGWGSSGYYSEAVLKNAGSSKVFPSGTKMFFDHPSESEIRDRPERSVRDLGATFKEDAYWDASEGALVAEAQVFAPYRELLTDEDFTKAIGVSIVAYADSTIGEAEGRKGTIITSLEEAVSVDFVTWAGRGGSILEVYESARPERVVERATAHGVQEASAEQTRSALQASLRDAYGADERWVYVLDFDEETVWFQVEGSDESGLFQQGYSFSGTEVALAEGDPTEVRRVITYVPVSTGTMESVDPVGSNTKESEEDKMPEIEAGRLAALEEAAGRVQTLESEREAAVQRAAEAERKLSEAKRRTDAERIISAQAEEAGVAFSPLEQRGLLAELPATESGELDEEAFTATVRKDAVAKAESSGAGKVTGFGDTEASDQGDQPTISAEAAIAGAFGRQVQEA